MSKLKEKIVPVRLSEEEVKIITEKAEKLGLKLSTYLRFKALQDEG
jgi:predicted DNA binding CopG/RHH family protein